MKVESWIFGIATAFFLVVTPGYWFATAANLGEGDWTGTTALAMTMCLCAMIAGYLGFHARKMDVVRPEDNKEGDIADGAGELGFFPPYSWWPLWCAAALAVMVYGIALGAWWLFIMAGAFGAMALCGLIFEYYRGEHAH